MIDPKPILVLGVNRSGTKWLCNEIARHPDVVAVAHEAHGGVLESNLLTPFGRSFDFADTDEYTAFLDFWTGTHFFHLAHGRRADFEQAGRRPEGPVEALRRLMDQYARMRQARFWVQKVGPLNTAYVLERLPDAHLVMIRRDIVDTVRSRRKLDRDRGMSTSAFRAAFSISAQHAELRSLCRGRRVLTVRYERLKIAKDEVMKDVATFLELGSGEWSDHQYPKNTSFPTAGDRNSSLKSMDLAAVRCAQWITNLVPRFMMARARERLTRATSEVLPGTYRHLESEADQSV